MKQSHFLFAAPIMVALPLAAALPALLLTNACSQGSSIKVTKSSQVNIVGGDEATSINAPAHVLQSTVAITTQSLNAQGQTFCSGTLIREDVVLTAAHCFSNPDGSETVASAADPLIIMASERAGTNSDTIKVAKFVRHEKYDHILTVSPQRYKTPSHDIALVFLDEKPLANKQSLNFATATDTIPKEILLAGYGISGKLEANSSGFFRWISNTKKSNNLNDFVPGNQPTKSDTGVLRFVETEVSQEHKEGAVFRVSELKTTPEGACPGDSGGPVYARTPQIGKVFGVLSTGIVGGFDSNGDGRADIGCVGENTYTDVRPYASWIESKLETR